MRVIRLAQLILDLVTPTTYESKSKSGEICELSE